MREAIDKALPMIRGFEGLRLVSVPVAHGRHEVGYGRNTAQPCVVTVADAEGMLIDDVRIAARAVEHACRVPLTINQRAALISLAYNIGGGALLRSALMRRVNAGDMAGAADEFGRWVHANGRELPGLVARRKAERDLFLTDDDPSAFDDERIALDDRGISESVPVPDGEAKAGEKSAGGWLLERAKEPSTWRGLGGLLAAAGVLSLGSVDALVAVGMAIFSAVEVLRKERGAS